jgi:hypothetical protein
MRRFIDRRFEETGDADDVVREADLPGRLPPDVNAGSLATDPEPIVCSRQRHVRAAYKQASSAHDAPGGDVAFLEAIAFLKSGCVPRELSTVQR